MRASSRSDLIAGIWAPAQPRSSDLRATQLELVRLATLAANSHNSQPWRFLLSEDGIVIHPDLSRRLPVVDPDDHHLWASLGCAAQNLVEAAPAFGLDADASFSPSPAPGVVRARLARATSDVDPGAIEA